jgi:hypothetical protein
MNATVDDPVALVVLLLSLVLTAELGAGASAADAKVPKCGLPAAMTAPGQSPEYEIVKIYLTRAKITGVASDPLLEARDLKGSKTLIIIIGGSGKGLGAAGIDLEDEIKRAQELLKAAESQKMTIVGMHLGGEARRGANSQRFIDLVTPRCDFLVVRSDGNKDGAFTKLAAEKKIPLVQIDKTAQLTPILTQMFQ